MRWIGWRLASRGGPEVAYPSDEPSTTQPPTGPETRVSVRHRPWSTLLLALHWVGVAAAAALLVLGVVLVIMHVVTMASIEDGEFYEPWGLVIAGVAGTIGGVVLAAMVPLAVATARGRRRADEGQPRSLFGAAVAGSAVVTLAVLLSGLGGGPASMLVVGTLCAPYLVVAVGTAMVTRA